MKKAILIASLCFISVASMAQATFGIQVGGNYANLKEETNYPGEPEEESDNKGNIGFLIGVLAEVPLTTSLSFRPELNFIQKGAEVEFNETESEGGFTSSFVGKGKTTMSFIELPLNIVYNVDAGMGKFFFGAGPSIGFGIGGKYDLNYTSTLSGPGIPTQTNTEKQEGDVKFDGKKDADVPSNDNDLHLKSLDFGANIFAGYKMANGLFFTLGYTKGFSNLNPNQYESLKSSGIQLKIGYNLGAKNAE